MKSNHPLRYRFWGEKKPVGFGSTSKAGTGTSPRSSIAATVDDGIAVIRLFKPIDSWGGWWGVSADEFANLLDEIGSVDEVRLLVNSPGGDTFEGVTIANLLRSLEDTKTSAHVLGLAASAASFIAVACDETVMAPQSTLMIHDAWGICLGNEAEMLKYAELLGKTSGQVAALYAQHAGGTADDWRELMRAETWYTDAEAVESGLAQRVLGEDEEEPSGGESVEENDGPDAPDMRLRFDLSMFNFAGRDAAPAPTIPAAARRGPSSSAPAPEPSTQEEEASLVDISDETMNRIRQLAGVDDAADEGTVLTALEEAIGESAPEPGSLAAVLQNLPEGVSVIETATLEQLRAGATAGVEARSQQLTAARDTAIQDAVRTGRIEPARVKAWTEKWDADPEGTATTLAALEPGLIPVSELGHDDQSADRELSALVGPLATGSSSQALAEFASGLGLTEEDLRV